MKKSTENFSLFLLIIGFSITNQETCIFNQQSNHVLFDDELIVKKFSSFDKIQCLAGCVQSAYCQSVMFSETQKSCILYKQKSCAFQQSTLKQEPLVYTKEEIGLYDYYCKRNEECRMDLGLACSLSNVCTCNTGMFWSKYRQRCASCDSPFKQYGKYCMYLNRTNIDNNSAKNICNSLNSTLVVYDSQDKVNVTRYIGLGYAYYFQYWIGLSPFSNTISFNRTVLRWDNCVLYDNSSDLWYDFVDYTPLNTQNCLTIDLTKGPFELVGLVVASSCAYGWGYICEIW